MSQPSRVAARPANPNEDPPSGTHDIPSWCDDIEKTVAELRARGVEFTDTIADHGYGHVTRFKAPGDFEVQRCPPRHRKQSGGG